MGELIYFPKHHVLTKQPGRGTSAGQAAPSGQCSENQSITSSYLRAVKVVAPASTRSKKRQSPAERRPRVDKLIDCNAANAEAQAMRFERSSVSMGKENSRKIPTAQAKKVGNFRLAENSDKSDKSAMRPVDQIRRRIQKAMDDAGVGPVTVALELGWERNHLRDYMEGKKDSLKTEKMIQISDRFGIPFRDLVVGGERRQTG
jgi:hypothetical protein